MSTNGGVGRDPLPHTEAVMDCYRAAHQAISNPATGGRHSDLEELHEEAYEEFNRRLNSTDVRYINYGAYRSALLNTHMSNADAKAIKSVFTRRWANTRVSYVRATEDLQGLQISKMSKQAAKDAVGEIIGKLYDNFVKLPAPLDAATGKPTVNPNTGKPRFWGTLLGDLSFQELARMVSYRQVLSKEDQISLNLMNVTVSHANTLGANSNALLRAFFAA